MSVCLIQHNPIVGDVNANAASLLRLVRRAGEHYKARLCLAPSLALCGHPSAELALVPGFARRCHAAAHRLAKELELDPPLVLTLPPLPEVLPPAELSELAAEPEGIYPVGEDAGWQQPEYWLLAHGSMSLLNADAPLSIAGMNLNVQDIGAVEPHNMGFLLTGPQVNATVLLAALPFTENAQAKREEVLGELAEALGHEVWLVNQCGATEGDIYAGQSCIFNADGTLAGRAPAFEEAILPLATSKLNPLPTGIAPELCREEALFRAAVCGIADYARKSQFPGIALGLSGGMDSALVACMAVEAVGKENVIGLTMPSRFSSEHSWQDAQSQAQALGMRTLNAPIHKMQEDFELALNELLQPFPPGPNDLTLENIQPRVRATLLMALSQRSGHLVLNTSNKSETALGYCTLYGDTVGALSPLADMYKTTVYKVAEWYNQWKKQEIIPKRVFTKAPSAELRPDQTDQDSLPPYDVLDTVLEQILENGAEPEFLHLEGVPPALVANIAERVCQSEFKRHQCAPVLRYTSCPFGKRGWHYPLTARVFAKPA